jgi:pimeloyl-ACP methyl ester carboxylesterase
MPELRLDDFEVHYEEQGVGERAIVFIHGGGSSSKNWKETGVWGALPQDYHAYAFDMRGHGSLAKVRENYTYAQIANDIYCASQKLKLGKFVCVGYSMGGWVAFQVALQYPEALKALIVVGGAPPSRKEQKWWKTPRKENQNVSIPTDPVALRAQLEAAFVRPSNPKAQEFIDRIVSSSAENHSPPVPGLPFPEAKTDDELWALLGTIKVPTLMINGCKDRPDMALRVVSVIPGAKLVMFQNESHMIPIESPEKITQEIINFVSQLNK